MPQKTTHQFARELLAIADMPLLVMRSDGDCFDPEIYIDDNDPAETHPDPQGPQVFIGYHHDTITHRELPHEHLRLAHPMLNPVEERQIEARKT